jgi:hypothetical protein
LRPGTSSRRRRATRARCSGNRPTGNSCAILRRNIRNIAAGPQGSSPFAIRNRPTPCHLASGGDIGAPVSRRGGVGSEGRSAGRRRRSPPEHTPLCARCPGAAPLPPRSLAPPPPWTAHQGQLRPRTPPARSAMATRGSPVIEPDGSSSSVGTAGSPARNPWPRRRANWRACFGWRGGLELCGPAAMFRMFRLALPVLSATLGAGFGFSSPAGGLPTGPAAGLRYGFLQGLQVVRGQGCCGPGASPPS